MSKEKAVQGQWVRLHIVAMTPEERAAHLPEDTKSVPLEMWVKGYLLDEQAAIGEQASVRTRTGRTISGTLVEINPSYSHSFGETVPELLHVGDSVKEIVFGGAHE